MHTTALKTILSAAFAYCGMLLVASTPGSENECRAGDCNGPGYWIVSTYSMPQMPGSNPKCLNFKYYFKPVCGKMRRGTCSEMQQSLNPSAPTCFFIHGSYVGIDVAIKDANNTYGWIKKGSPGCPLNLVFLVWPSDENHTGIPTIDVTRSGIVATQTGIYLAHLIDRIPGHTPICLVGHSHGTRTVAGCLHYRGGGQIYGVYKGTKNRSRPIRVVFAAAAINHAWMNPNNRYGKALPQIDSMLNILNHRDLALTAYPLVTPSYGRALAKTGITRFDKRQLGDQACKIHELDATDVIGFRHSWPNYYGRPELAKLIAPFVFFSGAPPQGSVMQARSRNRSNGKSYANGSQRRSNNSANSSVEIELPQPTSEQGEPEKVSSSSELPAPAAHSEQSATR